jgi:hypothetical protein
MKRLCVLATGVMYLGACATASADESMNPATVADVRCVVVGSVFANDPANAQSAALLTMYFLGRIDGREPSGFDLAQAMRAQVTLMSPADFSAEGKRCGKELGARAVYLADVSKSLTDQAKSLADQAKSLTEQAK